MELHYQSFDPTKNITLLVETPVPRALHAPVARALLARDPSGEQVGFLEPPTRPGARLHLQMMGGEFCGNASLSAAAHCGEADGLRPGDSAEIPLEVSGSDGLVLCQITCVEDGVFRGTVAMPLPDRLDTVAVTESLSCPAVFFPGIVHCIVPADALTAARAEALIRPLCARLHAEALGLLLLNDTGFTPLVYVASTDTAVWESGCGSGSAAIGASLCAQSQATQTVSLTQPGGSIAVSAVWDGSAVSALSITGRVEVGERRTWTPPPGIFPQL
ncbi:MAG: hypothetical protein RR092_04150 [Oscillospiraceae bacterium]